MLLTKRTYPSRFRVPQPEDTPASLFASEHRFINKSNPREILIYTDGSCLHNGQDKPAAGFAFVYRPSAYSESGSVTHTGTTRYRLETEGPTGKIYKQTSNRAELRAVIAALQFCDWATDCNRGWRSVVIATDSEYVAVNCIDRIKLWESNSWTTQQGADIKNQDMWKLLLKEIRRLQAEGVNVSFWRIPREWNERADMHAKEAAKGREVLKFSIRKKSGPKCVSIQTFEALGKKKLHRV